MFVPAYLDPGEGDAFLVDSLGMLLIVLIAFAIWIGASFVIARWAERRGQSFLGFLLLGLIAGPLIVAIAALIVGDRAPASATAGGAGRENR